MKVQKRPESLRIGVLSGGHSSERKISIRSGRAVDRALRRGGFETVRLDPRNRTKMLRLLESIDVAFLALHGRGGEDGKIQQDLERQGIPYVGSDPVASRRAFDKAVAKKVLERAGLPTPQSVIVRSSDWKRKLARFSKPFFMKPLQEGSSIGVFEVEDLNKSAETITQALAEYGELLAEEKIKGREFTVGILGKKALPVVELVPKRPFYDYRAKYTKGMTEYRVPAPLPSELTFRLQRLALSVHRVLDLRDMSRVDIMVDEAGHPYVLEANSIPGFTELSLLPKAARAEGISFEALCRQLVTWAYGRANGRMKPKEARRNGKKKT